MEEEVQGLLEELMAERTLVEFGLNDERDGDTAMGMVLSVSSSAAVLGLVGDGLDLDGYAVVDLSFVRWAEESEHSDARIRVLKARGQTFRPPSVQCDSVETVIRDLAETGELVSVSDLDPEVSWVGFLEPQDDSVSLSLVDPSGVGAGIKTIPMENFALIKWGTRYLDGVRIMLATADPPEDASTS